MFTAVKDFVLKDIVLEFKDMKCLHGLKDLHHSYIPWSGASIRPTALVYILNDIMINGRKTMVECGAGISTIYVAALLKQIGETDRMLYSIDHDNNWLSIIKKQLQDNDLEGFVKQIHAPLVHSDYCQDNTQTWYDPDIIRSAVGGRTIDLLFVDGPPANKKGFEESRYPALPFFKENLAENKTVLLDDADRKGEAKIAEKWAQELGLPFKKSILSGNMYICRHGDSYNVM
ncbi:class I SAM-dependent methyltransferase [Rhodohalobacter mucosus]|uniref:Class I SAM-dependent methyltransferase n=1 Tax=Rhodohalobacter mucosus TaxID=2079485 RepID=A0A316TXB2_9BACT|nr:class I SAM-dependent methyltransferase [Rhodohalobacter mucosus]PWN07244.1 class I SAM-dependent methyltransferase [Rhodohalobacter mucosus]